MSPRSGSAGARPASFGNRVLRPLWLAPLVAGWLVCAPIGCSRADGNGRGEREPVGARRVAVLAPAAAEMLQALDLLDRVVAVGEFGPWPDAIAGLPRAGSYDVPDIERLLELECDLLLTTRSQAFSPAQDRLRSLGIAVAALDTSTYDGVFASLREVGRLFGREARAASLERSIREEIDALAARAASGDRLRVLFVVGRDPLFVAGPGSHIDVMIRTVGGANVAGDAISPYQQFPLEVVLERMPEVIIDCSDNRPEAPRGRLAGEWGRWEFLPAVREDRVYQVHPGRLVIPGLRLPEMTRLMGQLIHPEIFGEPEERAMTAPTAVGAAEGER